MKQWNPKAGLEIYETLWDAIGILQAFNVFYRILGILVALTLNASYCDSTHTCTMYMFMYKQRYTDEKKWQWLNTYIYTSYICVLDTKRASKHEKALLKGYIKVTGSCV